MIDKEQTEKVLEYLGKTITGEKHLSLQIVDVPNSYANVEEKQVFIQEDLEVLGVEDDEQKIRIWKGLDFHESAHITMSGSLIKEHKDWKTSEDGNFADFKDTVNVIEDVRIEHITAKTSPQTRKYLVEVLEKLVETKGKDGVLKTNNPLMALRIALENKTIMRYELDDLPEGVSAEEIEEFVDEAVDKFHENEVLEGNWNNVKQTAMEIHKIFERMRKKFPKMMSPSMQKLHDAKDLIGDLEELNGEFAGLKEAEGQIKIDLEKKSDKIAKVKMQTEDGVLSEEEGEAQIEGLEAESEKLKEKAEEVSKKIDENKEKHRDIKKEQDELMKEHSKLKEEEKKKSDIDGIIRVTDFEERKKDGKFSKKKAEEIKKLMEKIAIAIEEEEKEESEDWKELDREYGFQPSDVAEYTDKDRYEAEGMYKVPELNLAMEMAEEISSALKRELQLKRTLVKRKTSGKIDMKRVRKQYVQYGGIKDTDIFARARKKLPEHAVMVMVDFSGSMGRANKIGNAKQALVTLARTLSQLRVPYSIRGYSARGGQNQICDIIIKDFDKEEIVYEFVDRVFAPRGSNYGNRDGESWRYGAHLLAQQSGEKLLIVISDGQPCHDGTTYMGYRADEDSILAVQQIEEMGIRTLGISIDRYANDYIGKAFKNNFFFDGDKLKELATGLTEIYLETMKARK